MKWYWWLAIGVAILGIGYFGYKMFKKDKNDVSDTTGMNQGTNNNGEVKPPRGEMAVVGGDIENNGGDIPSSAVV